MTLYLLYMAFPGILYVLLGFFSGQSLSTREREKKYFLILAGTVMALMIGLRSPDIGSTDTMFYYNFWEKSSTRSFDEFKTFLKEDDLEIGFQFTVWVLSHFFKNGQWALIFSGIFMSVAICIFVGKNCKNPVLALTVFNCLGLFSFMVQGMRQAVAMCICLFAIDQCKNKKPLRFLVLVILASTFHASAIAFLPVYILSYARLNTQSFILFFAVVFIAILNLSTIFKIINLIINDDYTTGANAGEGGLFAIFIYAVIILIGLLYANRQDKVYPMFIFMAIIGLICMVLRLSSNGIIERINHYYAFAQLILVSNSLDRIRERNAKFSLCVIAFLLCFAVAVYKSTYSLLIPYSLFWQ